MFEWAISAQWWGYTWEQFKELDGNDQSFLVAVYRTNQQMKAVLEYVRYQKQKKAAARVRRK